MRHEPSTKGRSLQVECLEERAVLSATIGLDGYDYEAWKNLTISVGSTTLETSTYLDTQYSADDGPWTYDSEAWNLIGSNTAYANYTYRGSGYAVAVIDTGVDYNHPAFAGRILPGYDFVNNDADPMDDNGHGTHVAGIIGSANATYRGIAPGVNIIPLKVLGANGSGNFGDVEEALRWVINNRSRYNIAAVNMSLGAGNYTSNPYTFLEDEFATLIGQGVFIAAAAGNSFYTNNSVPGLGYPAVSDLVVSVGAVYDANVGSVSWSSGARDYTTAPDRIASFSQRSNRLDIMAPGAMITSAGRNSTYVTMAGTSMASPVVAGAAVLIRQALDATRQTSLANQTGILAIMQATGVNVTDGDDENDNVTNTGLTFKRLNLLAALNMVAANQPAPTPTPTAPLSRADELHVYEGPNWHVQIRERTNSSLVEINTNFGLSDDRPVVGDWNGDGFDEIGVYRGGAWYVDYNGSFTWNAGDRSGLFGVSTDVPLVGDFNGDGRDEIAVYRGGSWYIDFNGNFAWDAGDRVGRFGTATDIPVVGDWNGDGRDEIGVFRNGYWYFDWNGDFNWGGTDRTGYFGSPGDRPYVGDWNGTGRDRIGVLRGETWYYDLDRSYTWSGGDGSAQTYTSAENLLVGRFNPVLVNVVAGWGNSSSASTSSDETGAVPRPAARDLAFAAAARPAVLSSAARAIDSIFSSFASQESFHLGGSVDLSEAMQTDDAEEDGEPCYRPAPQKESGMVAREADGESDIIAVEDLLEIV
jgi:hypothetical protein